MILEVDQPGLARQSGLFSTRGDLMSTIGRQSVYIKLSALVY
jgi:hypothetical protein